MAHQAQIDYCNSIKKRFPEYFKDRYVLDAGSMDINGNNRYLFDNCHYHGLDLGYGPNVDIICPVHKFRPAFSFRYDFIISTEMLEHDKHWDKSLKNMFEILKPGGFMLITAATTGRQEHGTKATDTFSSPFTLDYYCNVTRNMLEFALPLDKFIDYELDTFQTDIRFWGIKI